MSARIDLSIVIPALGEGDRIQQTLCEIEKALQERALGTVEVLVVAQSDGDFEAATQALEGSSIKGRVLLYLELLGKGAAVRAGMSEASGRYRMFMDADLATPLHHLSDVESFIDRQGNIGIAERTIKRTHFGVRRLLAIWGNRFLRLVLVREIRDTQCGFKIFEAEAADQLFSQQSVTGWAFDVELLVIARVLGYDIERFSVDDWSDPKDSKGRLAGSPPISVAWEMFVDVLKVLRKKLTGAYAGSIDLQSVDSAREAHAQNLD